MITENLKSGNDFFKRILDLHEKLSESLSNEENMLQMAEKLSTLMCSTITVESFHAANGNLCAGNLKDEIGEGIYLTGRVEYERNGGRYDEPAKQYQTREVTERGVIYRLVSPIFINGSVWGVITAVRENDYFDELCCFFLKYSVNFFALKAIEERRIKDIIHSLQGDFIDDLLSARISDKKLLLYNAKKMNYDLTKPHRVIMMHLNLSPETLRYLNADEERLFIYKRSVTEAIKTWILPYGNHLVVSKSNRILLLLKERSESDNLEYARRISEEVQINLRHYYKEIETTIGIGRLCTELEEYRGSYEAAMKAIELGLKLNRRGEVLSIDQFGSYALIYDALNPQVIVQFCAVRLKKLIIYDIDHNSQLVETLRKFLNNRGNSYKTARDMNMSFSGFKYRLSRIEEISGQDLRNTQEFYNLSLALDILDLMGAEAVLGAGI